MRVLVSGGAGFIGSHIVDGALAEGHTVAVIDDLSSGKRFNLPAQVPLYEVDLRDRTRVAEVVSDFEPELVSHQAAQASVAVSVRKAHFDAEVNILGGLNLLDACLKKRVQKLVFASTGGAIYGEVPEGQAADEATPPAPQSPYAVSKLAFEQLLDVYRKHHRLDSTVLRYANVYGPRQDPHGEAGVVAIFFDQALSGGTLRINARRTEGDAGCIRDYVYVADVARANLAALFGRVPHRLLNVGSERPTTTLELATQIAQSCAMEPSFAFAPARAGDIERSLLDAARYRTAFGEPTPLATGLRLTLEWLRSSR